MSLLSEPKRLSVISYKLLTWQVSISDSSRGRLLSCSTFPLVFGFWELIHVIFLKLRKKELLANSQYDNYFHSKPHPRTILSGNSCHFMNLFSFANSFLFLRITKITWLNFQQLKTRGHVEHLSVHAVVLLSASSADQLQFWPLSFRSQLASF